MTSYDIIWHRMAPCADQLAASRSRIAELERQLQHEREREARNTSSRTSPTPMTPYDTL